MRISRSIFEKLFKEINKPFTSILVGPRQIGKSFLLHELEAAAIGAWGPAGDHGFRSLFYRRFVFIFVWATGRHCGGR